MSLRLSSSSGTWKGLVLLAFALVLAACKPRGTEVPFDPSSPEKMAAALEEHLRAHPEDEAAWLDLAHVYWLHMADLKRAGPILSRLADEGNVAATLDRLLIADARMQPSEVQRRAYALVAAAAKTPDDDPQAEFVDAAAEVASPLLAESLGSVPKDEERFVAFFDELDARVLPFSVQQPLISARASLARRRDEPYEQYFEQEGCLQDWSVSAVLGTMGVLELERRAAQPFAVDPEARVIPLSCVVRVWNPTRRVGIRRLRTFVDVPSDTLQLDLSAEEAVRVYLDGRLLYRTDVIDRYPARRRRLDLTVDPGVHELEVATVVPGEKSWVLVRATDGTGRPVGASGKPPGKRAEPFTGKPRLRMPSWPEPLGPLDSPIDAPLRHYLAVGAALAEGDSDRAERRLPGLAEAERFAEAYWMRARFERADPTRPSTVSGAREQASLEQALELAPGLDAARLRLLEILLNRGDDVEALAMLDGLPKTALRTVEGELLRYRAHNYRGNEYEALQALERAEALNADNCLVLLAKRAEARDRNDVRSEDALTEELADCGGSLKLRARLAETRDRIDEAESLWREVLDRLPDEVEALEGLARLAAVRNEPDAAAEHLRQILALNPYRLGARLGLADLAIAGGDEDRARAELAAAIERIPHSDGLRQSVEVLGLADDLMQFRADGREALKAYQASGKEYQGVSEVLVLDRSVARVYDGGGQRHIVHLLVHLLSKEALDRYGEVDVPDGARLLTLHSIKPDGRILEPESVSGKEGLELRHLEVGDFVEYEFVIEQQPTDAIPDYVDVSTFRFQSLDIPYHRSELIVVAPKSIPLKIDHRNDAPTPEKTEIDVGGRKLTKWHFLAENVPRLGVEPAHRSLLDEVPNVRVYTELDVRQWMRNLGANIRWAQRTNPELRKHVRTLIRGKESERERLQALWSWVVENVTEGGDLATPATGTFAARAGSRLMLLRTMLEIAGVDSELWLARDAYGPAPLPDGHPMVENHDAAMLAVRPDGAEQPTMVMTVSKVMPLGYLTPGYVGAPAYRIPLDDDERGATVEVPARPPELQDRRRWTVSFDVDAGGAARVQGKIRLQGMEAVLWRQALRDVDRDRVEEVFQQAELGWLAGAQLVNLKIDNERDLDAPLVLSFEATANDVAIRQNGSLILRSLPLPVNTGSRFTSLPRRKTGLVIPYAPQQEAEVTYSLQGARFVDTPKSLRIESDFGRFVREVEAQGSKVKLRYEVAVQTGVVPPEAYPEMAAHTRDVEAATQAPLRAKPAK